MNTRLEAATNPIATKAAIDLALLVDAAFSFEPLRELSGDGRGAGAVAGEELGDSAGCGVGSGVTGLSVDCDKDDVGEGVF